MCVFMHVYICAYLYVLYAYVCTCSSCVWAYMCVHACVYMCLPVLLECLLLFLAITYSAPLNFMKALQYLNYLKIHVLYKASE